MVARRFGCLQFYAGLHYFCVCAILIIGIFASLVRPLLSWCNAAPHFTIRWGSVPLSMSYVIPRKTSTSFVVYERHLSKVFDYANSIINFPPRLDFLSFSSRHVGWGHCVRHRIDRGAWLARVVQKTRSTQKVSPASKILRVVSSLPVSVVSRSL